MTDAPATPRPRSRWKRWSAFAAFALALLWTVGWIRGRHRINQVIEQSRPIALAQTESEILDTMKGLGGGSVIGSLLNVTPTSGHRVRSKIMYFAPASTVVDYAMVRLFRMVGKEPVRDYASLPVEVRLDDEGKAYWIRRGSEIIKW